MTKSVTIGFLSLYLVTSIGIPASAEQPACKDVDSINSIALPTHPIDRERTWATRQAEIAIEFLRANRPARSSELNRQIQSRLKLSPADKAVLETIQNLEAGKNANSLLPFITNPSLYANSFSLQLQRLPLHARKEWILAAVEQWSDRDPAFQIQTINWILDLADSYQQANNQTETLNLLKKARSHLDKAPARAWINVATAYRKAGQPEIARSLLASVPDRITASSQRQIDRGTRDWLDLGHQLARSGQAQQGLVYIAQAEHLFQRHKSRLNSQEFTRSLALAYAAAGQSSKGLQLVGTLRKYDASLGYFELAKQAAELGDEKFAQQALSLIREAWNVRDSVSQVAEIFAKARKFEAARHIANSATYGLDKLQALAAIAHIASQANQSAVSQQIIQEISQIRSSDLPDNNIIQVIDALIEVGDRTLAQALLKSLNSNQNRFNLASKYIKIEDFATARRLLNAEYEVQKNQYNLTRLNINPFPTPVPRFVPRSPLEEFFSAAQYIPVTKDPPLRTKQTRKSPLKISPISLSQANRQSDRIAVLAAFANSYASARDFTTAYTLMAEIPDTNCTHKIRAWNHLITEAMKAGRLALAFDALQNSDRLSKRANLKNSEFVRSNLVAIAKLYSQANQPQEALLLLESALVRLQDTL